MKNNLFLRSILLLLAFVFTTHLRAQSGKTAPTFLLSFFNANTLLPGGGDLLLTSSVLHPGLNVGAEWLLRERGNNQWLLNAKAGYFYHRYAQHAIQLFGEGGYRRMFCKKHFGLESRLGLGYLHAIPDVDVFERDDSGTYSSKSGIGRPQAMISLSLCPSYTFGDEASRQWRVFLDYQLLIQTPFVKSYVPILPYTILHVGVAKKISFQPKK